MRSNTLMLHQRTEASAFYDIATATPVDMEVGTTVISYPEYVGPEAFVMHYY